jgi:ABC-2 type transport system ATP-binding protein
MIQVEGLSKRFREIRAVDGISLEIGAGEVYGLLGPNGAGKTTTLALISGLLAPDEGTIRIGGIDLAADPGAVKASLGVVPQETAFYDELTARENVRFWGGLFGLGGARLVAAVDATLERVGLSGRADSRADTFSGGMKRRLNLALGLVHSPRVLLLDEPTVGIDPQARQRILDVVRDTAAAGTTVLYTTHYLEEAERLCDRIGIIDHGKIIAEGSLGELERMVGGEELISVRGRFDPEQVRRRLEAIGSARVLGADGQRLMLAATNGGSVPLLSELLGGELAVEAVSIRPPGLNGLFLKLTGRELRD